MDCSLPGSFVHGVLQARILEGVLFPFPGDLLGPGVEPRSPALQADSFIIWTTALWHSSNLLALVSPKGGRSSVNVNSPGPCLTDKGHISLGGGRDMISRGQSHFSHSCSRSWIYSKVPVLEWGLSLDRASLIAQLVKNPPAMQKLGKNLNIQEEIDKVNYGRVRLWNTLRPWYWSMFTYEVISF